MIIDTMLPCRQGYAVFIVFLVKASVKEIIKQQDLQFKVIKLIMIHNIFLSLIHFYLENKWIVKNP